MPPAYCIEMGSRPPPDQKREDAIGTFSFGRDWGPRYIMVSVPSSRDRTGVHRTPVWNFSRPPPDQKREDAFGIISFLVETGGLEPSTSCV